MTEIYDGKQNDTLPRADLTDAQYELASGFAANWNRTRETIIEMAKLAKEIEDLPFQEKKKIKAHLEKHAKISPSVLSRLAAIGNNTVLTSEENIPLLPPSYNTLYALAHKKDDDRLKKAILEGEITPKLMRKDVDGIFTKNGKSQAEKDADKLAKNKAADPSIKLTFKGNFTNVPADKLQAFTDACAELTKCGVNIGRNEVNKVG